MLLVIEPALDCTPPPYLLAEFATKVQLVMVSDFGDSVELNPPPVPAMLPTKTQLVRVVYAANWETAPPLMLAELALNVEFVMVCVAEKVETAPPTLLVARLRVKTQRSIVTEEEPVV
jgi:hypothetical protein